MNNKTGTLSVILMSVGGLILSYLAASSVINAMQKTGAETQQQQVEVVDGKR